MPKIKLTAPVVAKLEVEEGKTQSYYWDEGCDGLLLRVSKSSRSYVFESRFQGSTVRVAIGNPKTWALGDARAQAREYAALVDRGIDPRVYRANLIKSQQEELESVRQEVAQVKVEEARNSIAARTVWNSYLDDSRDGWGARHLRDHENLAQVGGAPKVRGKGLTVPGVLAPLLAHPIAKIDAELVSDWIKAESKARANNARQGFEAFRAFWKWASRHKEHSMLITDPALFDNPEILKAKPKRKPAGATDVLERAHLSEWFRAVQSDSNKEVAVFLQLMVLTGARPNELLGLKWTHITHRAPANAWVHDKVEGDVGRHVPLGPYALWLLNSLPKRKWLPACAQEPEDVEWVFSSSEKENAAIHRDTPGSVHARALDAAGIPHISVYALRRSYATLSEWIEMPSGVTAQIQGHKASAVQERHYKRRPLELLSQWHSRFESWILDQAGIEFDVDNVKGGLRLIK